MKVAVYGTLRKNQSNYKYFLQNKSQYLETKKLSGYDMYNVGAFPAIIKGDGIIEVDVFEVNHDVLMDLDLLEGYNENSDEGMYLRRKHDDMYIYIWNCDFVNLNKIESGNWLKKTNNEKV